MGQITEYRCPQCGRSFEEMRGALMSDMGPEPAERRERRRLFMRGLRDRLHGIKRAPSEPVGYVMIIGSERAELSCRRCGVRMDSGLTMLVD